MGNTNSLAGNLHSGILKYWSYQSLKIESRSKTLIITAKIFPRLALNP